MPGLHRPTRPCRRRAKCARLMASVMRIEHLSSHQHLGAVAALLNHEWGQLSPWASVLEIKKRLTSQLGAPRVPFTLVALDDRDVLLGTRAGVRA